MNFNDSTDELRIRLVNGKYKRDDLNFVAKLLSDLDVTRVRHVLPAYLKYAGVIDIENLVHFVVNARDAESAAEAMIGLSSRGLKSSDITKMTKDLSRGVKWDYGDMARVAAVLALPRLVSFEPDVLDILKLAYHSSNDVVREAALTSAQTYMDVPIDRIISWGFDRDENSSALQGIRKWLGVDEQ